MDRSLRKLLTDCLRELEASGDIEACLRRYPERAQELRPHLEMAASLKAQGPADPQPTGQAEGHQRLLSRLAELEQQSGGTKQMTIFGDKVMRSAMAVAATVFLLGGTALASAALGGPNLVDPVADGVLGSDQSPSPSPSISPSPEPSPSPSPEPSPSPSPEPSPSPSPEPSPSPDDDRSPSPSPHSDDDDDEIKTPSPSPSGDDDDDDD